MQHSAYMSQTDGVDATSLPIIEELDYCIAGYFSQPSKATNSNYWSNAYSTIDEPIASSSAGTIPSQNQSFTDELCSSSPLIRELCERDPMVNGYSNYEHKIKINAYCKDSIEPKKVIVKHIEDDEQPSEIINQEANHLEDHSYYQNTPVLESDNSVTCLSNSSESEIDVCTERQPTNRTKKNHFKIKSKYRATKKMTFGSGKHDKSYHNQLERKRRLEQRESLDCLRIITGLSDKASKMKIINTARDLIVKLKNENDELEAIVKQEAAKKKLLSAKISKLMKRK